MCTVSLQLNTASDGGPLASPQKILFGQPITIKSEVTERIKRAQKAILNPSTSRDACLSGAIYAANAANELSFSSNRIVLHITGSDVADLNFIDLPGLFVGGKDRDMELIKNLAISYIQKPSCIILLTVACETDFVNQGAHRLAQEYDPHGDRTVGVLTKPDRIPATEEENWLPYIRGEKEDTAMTMWFCVKCPDSEAIDSGITWEGARQEESLWFLNKAPWSTLEESFRQKLGRANLTRCLSDKLCELIAKRLPYIEQELVKHLEKINQDLKALPGPPTSTPLSEVLRLIADFTREVERQGEGIPGRDGLLHQIKQPQDNFRVVVRGTAPCFVPQYRRPEEPEPIGLNLGPNRGPVSNPSPTPSCATPTSVLQPVGIHTYPPFLEGEERFAEIGLNDGKEVFIDDVLQTAEWAVTRELPNNYPFIVQKKYIEAFVKQWDGPVQTLFTAIVEKVKEATLRVVDVHFGNYAHSRFKQWVSIIVIARLEQCSKETSKRIEFLLKVEEEPSTRNTSYFKDYRRKFLNFYSGVFHGDPNDCFIDRIQGHVRQSTEFSKALDTIMFNLPKIGFRNVKPLELAILFRARTEDTDDALKIMADVRAYFQVSFKRFVDNAVKAVDEELVLGLSKGLQEALISGLKLDSPDAHETCAKLITELPQITEKRKGLVANQKKFLRAREDLNELYNALS